MMKYQSEMLGTWKRLREEQRKMERTEAESSKGPKWKESPKIVKDRLKVLDKICSTKEVTDLSAWRDFEIDGFEFEKSDVVVWFVLVIVTLVWLGGGGG